MSSPLQVLQHRTKVLQCLPCLAPTKAQWGTALSCLLSLVSVTQAGWRHLGSLKKSPILLSFPSLARSK